MTALAPPPLRQPLFSNCPPLAHVWQAWFSDIYGSNNGGVSGDYYTKIQSDARFAAISHTHLSTQITDFSTAVQTIGDARYSLLGHNHTGVYSLISHTHDDRYSLLAHRHSDIYDSTLTTLALTFGVDGRGSLTTGLFFPTDKSALFGGTLNYPTSQIYYNETEGLVLDAPRTGGNITLKTLGQNGIITLDVGTSGSILLPNIDNASDLAVKRWLCLNAQDQLNYRTTAQLIEDLGITPGVTEHGALTGLADDDHAQYHTDARGDARYSLLAHKHYQLYDSDLTDVALSADADGYLTAAFNKMKIGSGFHIASPGAYYVSLAAGCEYNPSDGSFVARATAASRLDLASGALSYYSNGPGLVVGNPIAATLRFRVDSDGNMTIGAVADAGSDTDKFLVLDGSSVVKYRTGTEVLSDIGGATSDHRHYQLYDSDLATVALAADASNNLTFTESAILPTDKALILGGNLTTSYGKLWFDSSAGTLMLTMDGHWGAEGGVTPGDLKIRTAISGDIILEAGYYESGNYNGSIYLKPSSDGALNVVLPDSSSYMSIQGLSAFDGTWTQAIVQGDVDGVPHVGYRSKAQLLSDIGAIGGGGTLNYLLKFTPDGNHAGDSQIIDNGSAIGVYTTPAALKTWWNLLKPIQIGATASIMGHDSGRLYLTDNLYHNGTKWIHRANYASAAHFIYNGTWYVQTAPAAGAGGDATMTTRWYMDNSGNATLTGFLGIGVAPGTINLNVQGDATTNPGLTVGMQFTASGDTFPAIYFRRINGVAKTNRTYAMVIDSSGNYAFQDSTGGINGFVIAPGGAVKFPNDSIKTYWGVDGDCSISYDGTNMVINTREVGTGNLVVSGGSLGVGGVPTWKHTVIADAAASTGAVAQLTICGLTDGNKRLHIGFNTTDDEAYITSVKNGDANKPIRISSSLTMLNPTGGNVLVGAASIRNIAGVTPRLYIEGTDGNNQAISTVRNSADALGPNIFLGKSRGAVNGVTIVQSGDVLGNIRFVAADGVDMTSVAVRIHAIVDGTPGANDTPGALIFSTTADGAADTTERMRITSAGAVLIRATTAQATFQVGDGAVDVVSGIFGTKASIYLGSYNDDVNTSFGQHYGARLIQDMSNQPFMIGISNTSSTSPVIIGTKNEERVRITADGWVGIGTEPYGDPISKLQVRGDLSSVPGYLVNFRHDTANGNIISFCFESDATGVTNGLLVSGGRGTVDDIDFSVVNKFTVKGNGDVSVAGPFGCNGVTPSAKLAHIADPTTDVNSLRTALMAALVALETFGFTATS